MTLPILACLAMLLLPALFGAALVEAEMLSIKTDEVLVREGPGQEFSVLWVYGADFPVELVERHLDWVRVRDFEGDSGWVHKSLLSSRLTTIVRSNRHSDRLINIRSLPGSTSPVVAQAGYGVSFKVLSHQAGWVKIEHSSGLSGWVSTNLLWGY